ncbi:EF-P 5-aminopentanol modification-associated protein YfmH [Zongyangia hominis]|uniref:Insulinase family protein n=1 Tax=Zongyangia hominis TaxID=2763677 RepID=A0A926EC63_9FIRM|nr:pitrilysin family protein [Zongyangia hominis]MBC8569436.1 insulinase family protein [Zongyangia hominis]
MSNRQIVKNARLGESYTKIEHTSGLTLLLYPLEGYSSAYALFGTDFGSINSTFKTAPDAPFSTVPAGIAHFLEHKMFEKEDGDAFAKYAKTGASANAFTSFDKTCYLFSCSQNFEASLEILLDLVTRPYFTQESVEKEQGIIGQEIRMYDDSPDWRVLFNMLESLYKNHPVKIDIAGTVESIAEITADTLYSCYNTFYNLRNMVLAIAGNFDIDTVLRCCDKILKPAPDFQVENAPVDEPRDILEKRHVQKLDVATPLFSIGFKEEPDDAAHFMRGDLLSEIILDAVAGESSKTYRELYDAGLINQTFGTEVFSGDGYLTSIFAGESEDPDEVYKRLCAAIAAMKETGLPKEDFERSKRCVYGRYVRAFESVEVLCSAMITAHFGGCGIYDIVEMIADMTYEEAAARFAQMLCEEYGTISIVNTTGE